MGNLLAKVEFSSVQKVLLTLVVVFASLSVLFMLIFIIQSICEKSKNKVKEEKVQSVYDNRLVTQNYKAQPVKPVKEIQEEKPAESSSVDEMLASLDELTKDSPIEEPEEEVVIEDEIIEEVIEEPVEEEVVEEIIEEVIEEPAEEEVVEEIIEEVIEEPVEEEVVEEIIEEVIEEPAEEVVEEIIEEVIEEPAEEEVVEEIIEEVIEEPVKEEVVEEVTEEPTEEPVKEEQKPVVPGSVEDYQNRYDRVKQTKEKLDKDLAKVQKDILKYERTERRRERNQKMLDRRAGELTNLTLSMYSVTDIKNVGEEKKKKQEDLTAHIAELKASIQDADEYLDSNRDKNEHNLSVAKFLQEEQAHYIEEMNGLEKLIGDLSEGNDTDTENS